MTAQALQFDHKKSIDNSIRPIHQSDIPAICHIYNYYIKNTVITFEEVDVTLSEIERRVELTTKEYPWFVYEINGAAIGYAYATSWKTRSGYRYSAECTIYLSPEWIGKGIGKKLYSVLIEELKKRNLHYLIGGIALPNEGSIALHEKLNFKKCSQLTEVGYKFNKWIDVGYWELII